MTKTINRQHEKILFMISLPRTVEFEECNEYVSECVNRLRERGVDVCESIHREDLATINQYSIVIIVAHHDTDEDALILSDGKLPIGDFVSSVPEDFSGELDFSSCYSDMVKDAIKKRCPHCHIQTSDNLTALPIRLMAYPYVIDIINEDQSIEYHDAYIKVLNMMLEAAPEAVPGSEEEEKELVKLGKKRSSVGGVCDSAIGGVFFGGLTDVIGSRCVGGTVDKKDKHNASQKFCEVYGSIFAPAEIKRKSHMIVQVYLHLFEETEKVKALAQEAQKDAERRDYIPLQSKLKNGDKVDLLLNIYGETLLMSEKKSLIWQGVFTKCSFDYFVPKNIDVEELSCMSLLTVNEIPIGEMRFVTKIVDAPKQLNPEIIARKFSKVFISYSHQDESKVKFLHKGLELGGVPHFFDRKYLKAGDVFPQVIKDYINTADLFILCWSENASKSEYVKKERLQAMERAFPQVKPQQVAKLSIYPMSIEPRAELPIDMKENYHFGEI